MEKLTLNLSRVKHFLLQLMPIRRRWLQFHVLTGSLFLYAFLMPERMNKEVDGGPLVQSPISENVMLKMAGVMMAPPAGLECSQKGEFETMTCCRLINEGNCLQKP